MSVALFAAELITRAGLTAVVLAAVPFCLYLLHDIYTTPTRKDPS